MTDFRYWVTAMTRWDGRNSRISGSVMDNIAVALLSPAEFEIARGLISGLEEHMSYDDWLDCRYGLFMGRSVGGEDAGLVTVGLKPFLEWCARRGVRPSESTLDAFADQSAQRNRRSVA